MYVVLEQASRGIHQNGGIYYNSTHLTSMGFGLKKLCRRKLLTHT